jgi:hypothetical protein
LDSPGKQEAILQDCFAKANSASVSSSCLNTRPYSREWKKENALRGSQFLFHFSRHPGAPGTRTRQSNSLADAVQRERNNHKEILVNVKSNDSPSLPLHLRCIGTLEEEWTPASALADLTRNVEAELEGKILKFSLNLKGHLALEWSWQEDHVKGGWECTILAHITLASVLLVRKRRKICTGGRPNPCTA